MWRVRRFGRESRKYMPYAASASSDGSYKPTAGVDVMNYYSPTSGWDAASAEPAYKAQGSPGEAWQLMAQAIPSATDYGTNAANDCETLAAQSRRKRSHRQPFYQPGRTAQNTIKDEKLAAVQKRGVLLEEYKNFDATVLFSAATSGMSELLNYDDMGNITHLSRVTDPGSAIAIPQQTKLPYPVLSMAATA
ncbi:hypothetical protein FQR65_LT18369 [Abscondita terminalis]|nr:hypothetical protein FQR65_LT18369 [Abscondita terminalis]